jgi:S-DNA-T family DNA segregation ATPase FtsK/SpoIIIE
VRELLGLVLIGFSLYMLLAVLSYALPAPGEGAMPSGDYRNLGGRFGYAIGGAMLLVFGRAAVCLFLFGLLAGALLFSGRRVERVPLRLLGAIVFTAMASILFAGPDGVSGLSEQSPHGAGGRIGAVLSPRLERAFGGPGRVMVVAFGALVALVLATEWLVSELLLRARASMGWALLRVRPALAGGAGEIEETELPPRRARRAREPRPEPLAIEVPDPETEPDPEAEPAPERASAPAVEEGEAADGAADKGPVKPPARATRARARGRADAQALGVQQQLPFDAVYPFPPLDLFRVPEVHDAGNSQEAIERGCRAIERVLASFKIGAKVVRVASGPAVTQFEIKLEEGIKVSRVVSFEADLSAALRAVAVRVVAPIPGKDTVGIEVPNAERQMVFMRELLEGGREREDMAIPLFLGKDVAGAPIVEDLARMPHLLIAGTTGSGKSVCINCILLSVLMTRSPRQVRLILIDPKMVELQAYRAVPHLSCDVVTNMKKAPAVLAWAVDEMEKRYERLSAAGVNHIASYNRLGQAELEERLQRPVAPEEVQLPYQVLVIDELADLMSVAQSEVEESIQRLAQKSRAVGLHVILATQRPSTDVITGVIKANLPCQIAFKVNRKIDSRVILDANGAEKLLGHGDMLYVPPGAHKLIRAQGAYVSDAEIGNVVRFLEENGPRPAFLPDLLQTDTGKHRRPRDQDDQYDRAVEVILGQQRGSATLLQRALAVGYTRATRLLEMMEDDGLVGPFNGSRSREVLLTLEEWKAREADVAEELAAAAAEEGAPGEADGGGADDADGESAEAELRGTQRGP